MSTIKVKVVPSGQKAREMDLPHGTTVETLRRGDLLGIDDIATKDILVNSMQVPTNTELHDGDIVVITPRPEAGA